MLSLVVHLLAFVTLLFAVNGKLRARRILQWQMGVLVTEFGIFFSPLALAHFAAALLLPGFTGVLAGLLAVAAFTFFVCPDIQSLILARKIPGKLRAAFGPSAVPAKNPPRAGAVPGAGFWRKTVARVLGCFGPLRDPVETRSLEYPAAGDVKRRIIFYPAVGRSNAPCVVAMHSGGWAAGSPEEFAGCHSALAREGYAVACVEYGLTPAHAWPTPRDDVRAAIVWLKANAAGLGIDAGNLVLLGRSAGGQVVLCAAYDDPDPAIRGVAAFYAPTDMVFSWRGSYEGDMLDSPKLLSNYLGGRPHECPDSHAEASPILHAGKRSMPTLLLHGARDEIVWCIQIRRLARILNRAGSPHFALLVPWGRHGFDYRLRGPGGRIAWKSLTGFLAAVTKS
jgi:acetyl esterase/lipase